MRITIVLAWSLHSANPCTPEEESSQRSGFSAVLNITCRLECPGKIRVGKFLMIKFNQFIRRKYLRIAQCYSIRCLNIMVGLDLAFYLLGNSFLKQIFVFRRS